LCLKGAKRQLWKKKKEKEFVDTSNKGTRRIRNYWVLWPAGPKGERGGGVFIP